MSETPALTVFISHSNRDREFVEKQIVSLLKENGISTWYSHEDIRTASQWEPTIVEGLEASEWFLVVMSSDAIASDWVRAEVDWAIRNRWGRIIPVVIDDCSPERLHLWLSRLQHVDFRDDVAVARQKLLATFGKAHVVDAEAAELEESAEPLRVPVFHFGSVVPPNYFVGRESELRECERIINGGHSFVLVGHHRDGKTSLCKMLIHRMMSRPDNSVLVVYLNVQMWPDLTIETFLEHTILGMVGEIARQVFRCKYTSLAAWDSQTGAAWLREDDHFQSFLEIYRHLRKRTYSRDGASPDPFQAEEFGYIHQELLETIRAKGFGDCVVFYDEANRLPKDLTVERLVSHEEALAVPGRMSVYAATPAMAESFLQLRQSFAHEVVLAPFGLEDVRHLVACYYAGDASKISEVPATELAVERLWELSRGKPYYVQLLAGKSFSLASEKNERQLRQEHVDAAFSELSSDPRTRFEDNP